MEDIYDFSGVSSDLNDLKFELEKLQSHVFRRQPSEDDEEWYPPTPPPYDVADQLIEINKRFNEDPTSLFHEPSKLCWKRDDSLVQVKFIDELESEQRSEGITSPDQEHVILRHLPYKGIEDLPVIIDEEPETATSESVVINSYNVPSPIVEPETSSTDSPEEEIVVEEISSADSCSENLSIKTNGFDDGDVDDSIERALKEADLEVKSQVVVERKKRSIISASIVPKEFCASPNEVKVNGDLADARPVKTLHDGGRNSKSSSKSSSKNSSKTSSNENIKSSCPNGGPPRSVWGSDQPRLSRPTNGSSDHRLARPTNKMAPVRPQSSGLVRRNRSTDRSALPDSSRRSSSLDHQASKSSRRRIAPPRVPTSEDRMKKSHSTDSLRCPDTKPAVARTNNKVSLPMIQPYFYPAGRANGVHHRTLDRKTSRNSLSSSNSSDSGRSESIESRKIAADLAYLQWRQRKKAERKLRERQSLLIQKRKIFSMGE